MRIMINNMYKKIRKILNAFDYMLNIEAFIKRDSLKRKFEESVHFCNEPMIDQSNVSLGISLTTYGQRIFDVHLVIESIALQTVKPERIILWLDKNEFTLSTIPLALKKQIGRGLEIRFCENLKSYKKLIPSITEYPEYDWITIDDDYLYPCDMVELLLVESKVNPDCIIGHRAHKMTFNSAGKLRPYLEWDIETNDCKTSASIFLTSGAGTLFPSGCFKNIAIESEVFMNICGHADDVWFKSMALLSNTPCKKINDPRPYDSRFTQLESGNVHALSDLNVDEGHNDKQIKLVFDKYKLWIHLK
ncbi:hypothetical glycosyl transferase [Photobacterium profundum SS9]|uniref:Hypothetical glycosyl transferase n=2 Tax=Photobacterium profundum TaxID=74109 RepID=Q6LNR7_PHOPR|nr:hypothetical glycosyl transferase [Photobacterium profundum SS9]